MTAMTRRDALILTTAATAVTSTLARAADDPKPSLVVGEGVQDGSSIPIGLKIPLAALDKKNSASPLIVTLQAQPTQSQGSGAYGPTKLFTLTIQPLALGGDVAFATRLRLLKDFTKGAGAPTMKQSDPVAATAFSLTISQNNVNVTAPAPSEISFGPGNCPPADSSTLRTSVQPGQIQSNSTISVKALAPKPLPVEDNGISKRKLKSISYKANDKPLMSLQADDDQLLTEEVYMAFSHLQSEVPATLDFKWDYGGDPSLESRIYLAAKKSA